MRRSAIAGLVIPVLGLALLGAPCVTKGPQNDKAFAAKSLVIPMDNCYQKRDTSAPNQSQACNAAGDDGVLRAYGLVYFLLRKGVPVYWAIDGATPKTSVITADITVTPDSGGIVVKKYNWASGQIETFAGFPASTPINYIGGPFIIHADDVNRTYTANNYTVLQLLALDPDIAKISKKDQIDIHEVEYGFVAKQVRPLSGMPPRIAILNISGPATSADVMIQYAKAAGFDWPCSGTGDCAGGISGKANNGDCSRATASSKYGISVNNGPGLVYDLLCDADFLPEYPASGPPDFTKATLLAKDAAGSYVYKLLWAPHWETKRQSGSSDGTIPDPSAAVGTDSRNLADWLQCIRNFVDAGNNLFAECHAIVTLEGGYGAVSPSYPTSGIKEYGLPITRFQTTNAVTRSKGWIASPSQVANSHTEEPYMQIADFAFSVTSGNVAAYLADPNGNTNLNMPASSYQAGVQHFITENRSSPSATDPNLDVFTAIKPPASGAVMPGNVLYLGGHSYSLYTAGTRIVLNTLFNLGFSCVEPAAPDNTCSTGLLGRCAAGTWKCSGAALTCVPNEPAAEKELCDGQDNNCDGVPGQICNNGETCDNGVCIPSVCTEGEKKPCYEGAAETRGKGTCRDGTQTCSGGMWGACTGQVLPGPAVCNGKDNNCDNTKDTDCPTGWTCQNDICIPNVCGLEEAECPTGFNCTSDKCVLVPGCPTCTGGKVCVGGTCIDPCSSVTCPQGTICAVGVCQSGGCYFSGCPNGQVCSQGSCVTDPCAGMNCPTGTFCRAGDCVRSCESITCPVGQVCGMDGFCEPECAGSCGAGEICVLGTCQTDPCSGTSCGRGQICSGGVCVDDPCRGVTCQSDKCANGQCPAQSGQCVTNVSEVGLSGETPVASAKGGCSTSGAGGLVSLALVGLGIVLLRRRPQALASLVRAAGMVVLVALVAGCGNSGGGSGCSTGLTQCGDKCVDLTSDAGNCGACGCACKSGYSCAQKACLLPTGNPYLSSISPSVISSPVALTLQLTGTGFDSTAKLRIAGAGMDGTYNLTVSSATAATATLDAATISQSHVGTAQVRVVIEPAADKRLTSNALPLVVKAMPYLLKRSPAFVQQDTLNSSTTIIELTGTGLASGLTATLTPEGGGTSQPVAVTFVNTQSCQITLPTTLALGTYLIQVINPDGSATNFLPVTVGAGMPVVTSPASGDCRLHASITETMTGKYLYPTSVAHVSGAGVNSTLPTQCVGGQTAIDAATGQCQNGLSVTADLTQVQNGSYDITIWNPGSPEPLKSTPPLTYTVKDSCP